MAEGKLAYSRSRYKHEENLSLTPLNGFQITPKPEKTVRSSVKELQFPNGEDEENRPQGCYKQQHWGRGKRCLLCNTLNESQYFKSNFTGLQYKIKHHLTCKSSYCVYLITCLHYANQYTGSSTQAMHRRHGGHRHRQ